MARMTLEDTLKTFGLTDKETEVYIYLAKQGVQKTSQIAKALKANKGLVYRILKSLEQKELVEITLESPSRYIVVPFERIIDNYIQSKREEATRIEDKKQDLLSDWKQIGQSEFEPPLERFSVIEGERKVFHKISLMVQETREEFVSIATTNGLLLAEKYGVLDNILNLPSNSGIKFRYVTNVNEDNLDSVKFVLGKLNSVFSLKGKKPDLQNNIFPRFVIRDNEEILLFISSQHQMNSTPSVDTALCTNCKSIIQSFYGFFEDVWSKSSDIEDAIQEIENGIQPAIMDLIKDPSTAKTMYYDALNDAKRDILIVSSSNGLFEIEKDIDLLKNWCKKGISVKIMAPIINENLNVTHRLLEFCEVRHIPVDYREITIIDSQQLFQFNDPALINAGDETQKFQNVFFTTNSEYIEDSKRILFDVWRLTHTPSFETLRQISDPFVTPPKRKKSIEHATAFMKNLTCNMQSKISEQIVHKKISEEKKNFSKDYKDWNSTIKYFGSRAFARIHASKTLGLPDMILLFFKIDDISSFGAEKWVAVNVLDKETKGANYVPVAFVQDNPGMIDLRKEIFRGFPAENNVIVFNNDQIQLQMKGNTFYAGWTKPISLGDLYEPLPPSYLLFEGYGEIKPGVFTNCVPSGRKQELWYNSLDSFVTIYNPQLNYVGSGTESFIERETLMISRA